MLTPLQTLTSSHRHFNSNLLGLTPDKLIIRYRYSHASYINTYHTCDLSFILHLRHMCSEINTYVHSSLLNRCSASLCYAAQSLALHSLYWKRDNPLLTSFIHMLRSPHLLRYSFTINKEATS